MVENVDELIAELRGFAAGSESARASLMRDAAETLEEMKAQKDWEWLYGQQSENLSRAEAERDEALAVISEVLDVLRSGSAGDPTAKDRSIRILSRIS